jgi:hypothetical protein
MIHRSVLYAWAFFFFLIGCLCCVTQLGILQFSILQCRMCHSAHSRIKDSVTRLSYDNALDVDVCDKHFGNGETN